uniref:Protein TRANSPARENT TESTA 12 n=1 Tax=Enterobius vermicularis TaxID=51028 RepID=A0A0N4VML7_ENTVE
LTFCVAGICPRNDDDQRGWKLVQKSLPRILEYGREEGILKERVSLFPFYFNFLFTSEVVGFYLVFQSVILMAGNSMIEVATFNLPGLLLEGADDTKVAKEQKTEDKVNLPTNDITVMHEAIPFLPVPIALLCLTFNILLPGFGKIISTILSGICGLCMGQPRINFKEGRKLMTLLVNFLVGVSQFFTITFLFVGWFWSISWGILIIIHSMQYREALQQRRQEAVATAAIEALTKDSILHRRDVKTLVKSSKKPRESQS